MTFQMSEVLPVPNSEQRDFFLIPSDDLAVSQILSKH